MVEDIKKEEPKQKPIKEPIKEKSFVETQEEKPKPRRKNPYDSAVSSFNEQVNTLVRTIRLLEERYSNLRKKTQVTDQNMLEDVKNINTELKLIDSDINEMKQQFLEVNEKISLLSDQIKKSVKKEDLSLLDKYLNLWSPLKFITVDEAKKIIEDNK